MNAQHLIVSEVALETIEKESVKINNNMSVLYKPLITEKATSESELRNRYTFLVRTNANKIEIKKAVELKYGVSVEKS